MLATEVAGLKVVHGLMDGETHSVDDGGFGWRVLILSIDHVVPVKFMRMRDALIAMHSMKDFTDWTQELPVLSEVVGTRRDELLKLMTRNLAW